jgi:membrane protein
MRTKIFLDLLRVTVTEWWNDNTLRLAASLAFYTIFSLAPMVIIVIALAGIIFGEEAAAEHLVRQVEWLVGPQGREAIHQLSLGFDPEGSRWTILLGLVMLFIGSTAVFAELQSALNQIWDVEPHPSRCAFRGFLSDRVRSFGIVLGVGFLLLVSLVISAALAAAHDFLDDHLGELAWLWRGLNIAASFLIIALLFAMIYKYLPDVWITWQDVSIGAVVTALLFTLGKYLIGLYLGQAAFGSAYGAAGSFIVLLIWVYYSALISFFGAEFTQVYARRYGSHIHPRPYAVRIGAKSDSI